jgi:translation initiation factor IF-3
VVSEDGEQVGIITFEEAQEQAKAAGLDLVIVAEKSTPPVCRIMDFGKLRYEQKKKLKAQKSHQHANKLKEVKFRVSIDEHDYQYKVAHAVEFLTKGNKVKVTLMFRGREMAHKDIGFELINRIIEDVKEYGVADGNPSLLGRNIIVTLSPHSGKGHHH